MLFSLLIIDQQAIPLDITSKAELLTTGNETDKHIARSNGFVKRRHLFYDCQPLAMVSLESSFSSWKRWKNERTKHILTTTLFICFLSNGIGFSILPPTLLDIVEKIEKQVKDCSMGFVGRAAAYSISALLCEYPIEF